MSLCFPLAQLSIQHCTCHCNLTKNWFRPWLTRLFVNLSSSWANYFDTDDRKFRIPNRPVLCCTDLRRKKECWAKLSVAFYKLQFRQIRSRQSWYLNLLIDGKPWHGRVLPQMLKWLLTDKFQNYWKSSISSLESVLIVLGRWRKWLVGFHRIAALV